MDRVSLSKLDEDDMDERTNNRMHEILEAFNDGLLHEDEARAQFQSIGLNDLQINALINESNEEF